MICTYVTNERMTTLFSDVSTTLTGNVKDFTRYANNTVNVCIKFHKTNSLFIDLTKLNDFSDYWSVSVYISRADRPSYPP